MTALNRSGSHSPSLWTINSQSIEKYWDQIEPLMKSIDKWSHGKYFAEDMKKYLMDCDMQLWVAGDFQAIGVTQINEFPRQKVCTVVFMAGKNMDEWLMLHEEVVKWAKDIGCDVIEAYCRRGWQKLFNWDPIHTVLRKVL